MVFWCLVFGTNHTAVFQHLIDRMGFKYSKQSNFSSLIVLRTPVGSRPFSLQPEVTVVSSKAHIARVEITLTTLASLLG